MTDEDKLSELYAKANELEKRVKDGTVTDREIEEPLSLYRQQIGQLKGTMREKSLRDLRLRGQAVQERADRDAEITKAQEKETALQQALVAIKKIYGKNAILRGANLVDGATARLRNSQIGGHKA